MSDRARFSDAYDPDQYESDYDRPTRRRQAPPWDGNPETAPDGPDDSSDLEVQPSRASGGESIPVTSSNPSGLPVEPAGDTAALPQCDALSRHTDATDERHTT